jgi:hypothetical protein
MRAIARIQMRKGSPSHRSITPPQPNSTSSLAAICVADTTPAHCAKSEI